LKICQNFWATLTSNNSPCPIGQMSRLSVRSVLSVWNVNVLWPNGWMEIGLDSGHTALDGDAAPHPRKGTQQPPLFGPCLLWPNGWIDRYATRYGGTPRPRRHCVRWRPCSPHGKQQSSPPTFRPISLVAKRLDRSGHHLVRR